ncbi:hypothetical protein V9T40_006642 [Parthenolecanium corni]|uniref:Uncharacterized protein n=1 Tax=Parthenolecanium corni TaxID=536013 RepID=A0AAN9TR93_9HEMI
MKGLLYFLLIAFSCQSRLCEDVPSGTEYDRPTGGIFIQGELPKHHISDDKVQTHISTKVNTTHVRIEELSRETTTNEPELPAEAQTEQLDELHDEPETEHQNEPKDERQTEPETKPRVEPQTDPKTKPQVEPVATTDNTFLPCSILPCPFSKKADKNSKFKPVLVENSTSQPKVVESNHVAFHEYQLSLEFYHSLSFQLLLISLFCLTMVLLLTSAFIAMYLTKNGLGMKRFRRLENRDCGLNKYNF